MFGAADDRWLQELRRRHYPPDRNRVPAHITLFRQLPPSIEAELSTRLAGVTAAPAPAARITGLLDLDAGTALRVESPVLVALRDELEDQLHGLLTPQDQGSWQPHITIQNKVDRREARHLQRELAATFAPRPLAIAGLASWHYQGGFWQFLKGHRFRG
ncbi:MAG: 2'-5' RNA ligase family protein [Sphingosinicella sp.]